MSLCLLISLTGCATTPEPITIFEVREVYRDRYVPIPMGLVKPCQGAPLPAGPVDTLALGAAYKQLKIRLAACNSQITEISKLGEP